MMMNRELMTVEILKARHETGVTWAALAEAIGMSPIWTTSCAYGMNSMPADKAAGFCETLGLGKEVEDELQRCPSKTWDKAVPTDPLLYRLYEAIMVYGDSVKELIHEQFGDGIMSAIDYTMSLDKVEDPKGDRVILTLNGKFLPYKRW
ncbi:MAG: cyanase [Halomonadaceae bacterium]|nr:MAG: cyanase [Halomonadaceae bacterium]